MNNNANTNNDREEAGPPGAPPHSTQPHIPQLTATNLLAMFLTGQLSDRLSTTPPPHDPRHFGEEPSEHGSASSGSDTDTPAALLCSICGRRRAWIRFAACGHRACPGCTKKTWWARISRPDRARDPWPASIPCPYCRAEVAAVVDERDGRGAGAGSAVGALDLEVSRGGLAERGGDAAEVSVGGVGAGDSGGVGGRGTPIVDWMLRRSKNALRKLQNETAGRAAVGGGGDSYDGEGRDWRAQDDGELSDWNEWFFE